MKILYLFRSLAVWGGIERILVDKMNWLVSENNTEVFLLTTDQGEHPIVYSLNERVHYEDFKINFYRRYQYGFFRRFGIAYQMRQKYKRLLSNRIHSIKPDVIVCTTADQIDVIAKLKGDVPLIVESHSICNRTIGQGKNAFLRYFRRFNFLKSLKKTDCVVSLTEGDASEWRHLHQKVVVIPNMLHQCKQEQSSLTSKRVIWVGRFDYQKRGALAIRIWELVLRKHPDWCLDIYGEGEMKSEIEKKASLVKNVFVHKPTAEIFDCYHNSSIMILTSLFEPFGLVMIEAMSCGLPVVAFDCPYGPADIITDGMNGFLVPFDNIKYFADKVCLLMEDDSLRIRMGHAAYAFSKRFYADGIMPQWKSLFDDITKNNNIICKIEK